MGDDSDGAIIIGGGPPCKLRSRSWLGGGPIRFEIGETEDGIWDAGGGSKSGVLKRHGFGVEGVLPGGAGNGDEAVAPLGEVSSVTEVDALMNGSAVTCVETGVTIGRGGGGSEKACFILELSVADDIVAPIATGGGLRMAVGTGADGRSLYATEPAARTRVSSHLTPICAS